MFGRMPGGRGSCGIIRGSGSGRCSGLGLKKGCEGLALEIVFI